MGRRRVVIVCAVILSVLLHHSIAYCVRDKARGILDHDYFAMQADTEDPHSRWLVNDIERNHLDKAILYTRQGRLKEAINDCVYLLQRLVNHPKGLAVFGMVAKLAKQPSLPLKFYENALRLYPEYAITHAQYGKYLAEIGNPKAGMQRLKRAIEIDPKLQVSYTWLAEIYMKNGQAALAKKTLLEGKQARMMKTDTAEKNGQEGKDPMQNTDGTSSADDDLLEFNAQP
ncbi:MAG: tetratricopeptide repeat protein [Candidatus Binatia bacterium]